MIQLKSFILIILMISAYNSFAQITFQKQFAQPDSASSLQTFDAKATPDGGYVLTGIASEGANNNLYHPFIIKLNCKGKVMWQHYFGNTQSTGNVFGKVIVTADSGFAMINNLGVYNNYNGLVVRLDKSGNIVWQKLLNLSNGNDNLSDIQETPEGHFVLTGSVKSTPDVAIIKLSAGGNLIWCKTFGNNAQYDEGSAVIVTDDGGYMLTGRYISMGTFNAFLLKTDSSGTLQWLRCYGDTNQHMWGFDVKQLSNGDYVMVGSTTLLKPNFQSYGDNFIMRLNAVGDTLWTKIFYGSPDLFENACNVLIDDQNNFIVSVATASYPTPGFVPNKHAIMKFSPSGLLLSARTYNAGSSHYPRIAGAPDGGYIMSGFSNQYTGPVGFQTLLIKMDHELLSGCFETDVTALTAVTTAPFKITLPVPVTGSSGTAVNNAVTYTTGAIDTTLCAYYPVLTAGIDTAGRCVAYPVQFSADTTGITSWHWNFGDPSTTADTAITPNATYTYLSAGNYTVTLMVSNGCDTVINSVVVNVVDCNPESVESVAHEYSDLLVYPNPAGNVLMIESDLLRGLQVDVQMFDMSGRKVFSSMQTADRDKGKLTLHIAHLPKGIYMLKVAGYMHKVIKQ